MDDNAQYQKAVIHELKRISGLLTLLASDKIIERRRKLDEEYLTTSARKKIWELTDGSRNIADIAKEVSKDVKISSEGVRIFVNDLEKEGFVEIIEEGRNRYPRRLI